MPKHVGIAAVTFEGAALCYRTICAEAGSVMGIEAVIPDTKDREAISALIFDELVKGILQDSTREFFRGVVSRLADSGCDAVVMGCTEIPLILNQDDVEIPLLDSTRLLAQAALAEALREV